MNTTQQQYLIAIAENGSILGAAKSLGISQPAISSALKALEHQLGVQLVIRSKKQTLLTPAGKVYLEGARQMMEVKEQTYRRISELSDAAKEVIRISGTPNGGAHLFSVLFQNFKTRFPQVTLQFMESYNTQTMNMIQDGTVDLGLCSSLGSVPDIFEYVVTNHNELILMIPYGYSLSYDAAQLRKSAELPTVSLSELKNIPFIMPSPDMSYYDGITRLFRDVGYSPNTVFQSANVKVIYDMVKSGNGAAILPRKLFSPLDKVSPFSLNPKLIKHSLVLYRKGYQLTEPQKYLVDFLIHYASSNA